jgi:hypothetical protein
MENNLGNISELMGKFKADSSAKVNQIRPVLVFKIAGYGLSADDHQTQISSFATSVVNLIEEHEYICLFFGTKDNEHSVQLLNPNVNTEETYGEYMNKLIEIEKEMKDFFKK